MAWLEIVLALAFLYVVLRIVNTLFPRYYVPPAPTSQRGTVVISGTDSGIGQSAAIALAQAGYCVFAGVLSSGAAEELRTISKRLSGPGSIEPLLLDVTNDQAIQKAVETVRDYIFADNSAHILERHIVAVISNAGLCLCSPVEATSTAVFEKIFKVNFHGALSFVSAFIPLILSAATTHNPRGRIIFMSSYTARLVLPIYGAYAASKAALSKAADSLRLELLPFGISVSVIEPGQVRTGLMDMMISSLEAFRSGDTKGPFKDVSKELRERYNNLTNQAIAVLSSNRHGGLSIDTVVKKVVEVVAKPSWPKAHYPLGNEQLISWVFSFLPTSWTDRLILFGMGMAGKPKTKAE